MVGQCHNSLRNPAYSIVLHQHVLVVPHKKNLHRHVHLQLRRAGLPEHVFASLCPSGPTSSLPCFSSLPCLHSLLLQRLRLTIRAAGISSLPCPSMVFRSISFKIMESRFRFLSLSQFIVMLIAIIQCKSSISYAYIWAPSWLTYVVTTRYRL